MTTSSICSQTILFLAANPQGTVTLRLNRELRDISEGLQRSQKRDRFNLEKRSAVRPRDIQRAMLDVEPQILHFSGHGGGEAGLVFEDEVGNSKLVDGDALAGLFELFADRLNCVVLNGCYSEVQAQAIAQHIPYVIGMNGAISDQAAIAFAVGFYDALGAGHDVEFAFKFGCAAIQLDGCTEHLTPVLIKKPIAVGEIENLSEQKTRYEIVFSGSIDGINKPRIDAILSHLQGLTEDSSLTIVEVIESKRIDVFYLTHVSQDRHLKPHERINWTTFSLVLESSFNVFNRLSKLILAGELKEILGINIGGIVIINNTDKADLLQPKIHRLRIGLLMSFAVTVAISAIRLVGVLQPCELQAYNHTMRSRHLSEGQDSHILVIKVIAQNEPDRVVNRSNTLSDERLDKLLGLLNKYEPAMIGFDNFLNHKIDPKYKNIQDGFESGDLFVVCQAKEDNVESFKAPENAESIGFGDVIVDDDKVVRRHLLQMKIETPSCNQSYGLSLLLAHRYLEDKKQSIELPLQSDYGQIGNKKIGFLSNYVGGYQQFAPMSKNDTRGWQIMLNYRYVNSVLDGFSSISINDLFKLSASELSARIKGRIILIGTTEKEDNRDLHATPYGETIPGVFLQAQMTSQLVNAALHNRPLILAYPFWSEIPLIWLMTGMGWLVASRVRNRWILVGVNGLAIIMLFAGAVVLLTVVGYWFPLVPTVLGFGLGCSSVTIFPIIGTKLRRLHPKP